MPAFANAYRHLVTGYQAGKPQVVSEFLNLLIHLQTEEEEYTDLQQVSTTVLTLQFLRSP